MLIDYDFQPYRNDIGLDSECQELDMLTSTYEYRRTLSRRRVCFEWYRDPHLSPRESQ